MICTAKLILLLAAVTVAAYAQSQQPPTDTEIVTDRPDITESAIVVPKGGLQFENGLSWTSQTSPDLSENASAVL